MVQANYNPFRKKDIVETRHGIISYESRRYFTHRRPEHFFKKYQGFGISLTELEICYNERVDHILIKYHGTKKNILYKIPLQYLQYMQKYNNNGDEQIIIPIKEMSVVGEEVGLDEHKT